MKKRTMVLLAASVAAAAVSAAEGWGPFNRIKFKEQHNAVARYVETHYPHALYSPITLTKTGWATVIRSLNMPPVMLYIALASDGSFVFKEVPANA